MQSKDLGIRLVYEFHQVFNCAIGDTDKPSVPKPRTFAAQSISDYADFAAEAGEALKAAAASAKAEGDEAGALLLIRLQLVQEELAELAEAMSRQDIVESFDALVDLSYVVDGTYITLGLHERKEAGLTEVHRSNMSKLDESGRPIISDAGRVVKSDRYSPPNLRPIVEG
jgi:predicted HAD superfamily Cof-like phosphohydrolase